MDVLIFFLLDVLIFWMSLFFVDVLIFSFIFLIFIYFMDVLIFTLTKSNVGLQ